MKKLKWMNLSSLRIRGKVHINDKLCKYYRLLWKKLSLHPKQFIHAFWVTNGTVRLKAAENGHVHVITHLSDLKELFPENQLLSEED